MEDKRTSFDRVCFRDVHQAGPTGTGGENGRNRECVDSLDRLEIDQCERGEFEWCPVTNVTERKETVTKKKRSEEREKEGKPADRTVLSVRLRTVPNSPGEPR